MAAGEALKSLITLLRRNGSENLARIMFEAERGELLWMLLVRQVKASDVTTQILALLTLLLQSPHVNDSFKGRLRLEKCGIGGLLIRMKSLKTQSCDSAFISLIFTCNFSINDKFALVSYLGDSALTTVADRTQEKILHFYH